MKSIFNERRYLNDDDYTTKFFEFGREVYNEKIARSLEKYKYIIKEYNLYLDCIVEELLKYNFSSDLAYSIALGYLIKKGYLSNNLEFIPGVNNIEIPGKLGISILLGKGCCRNISEMHRDVFDKLDLPIIPFYCYQGVTLFNSGLDKEANHVINLVEYKGNLYGIDLHNGTLLYRFKNPFIMQTISSDHDEKLRYKPYYEIIAESRSIEEIKRRIEEFDRYSKMKHISDLEFELGIRYDVESILFENKDKLENFNDKTKVLRKSIINKMNKIEQ